MRKLLLLQAALMLCSAAAWAQAPTLVAHWDFNGPNVDLPNNVVYEALQGWPCPVTGKLYQTSGAGGASNTAVTFGAENNPNYPNSIGPSFVTVPHHPSLDLQSWTIIVIARITDCTNSYGQMSTMVWKGGTAPAPGYPIPNSPGPEHNYSLVYSDHPYDGDPNQSAAWFAVTAANAGDGPMPPDDPAWNSQPLLTGSDNQGTYRCIVGSYNAVTQQISVYIDGIKYVNLQWNYPYNPQPADLFIGNSPAALNGPGFAYDQFVGSIDDIEIYDGVFAFDDLIYVICDQKTRIRTASIQEHREEKAQITPNPAYEQMKIELPAGSDGKYVLKSITGAVAASGTFKTSVTVDTRNIPAGLYIISVQSNDTITEQKMLINH